MCLFSLPNTRDSLNAQNMGPWQPCVRKSWVLRQQVFWGVQPGGGWEPRIWVFSWEVAKLQRLQLNTTCSAEPLPLRSTSCPVWTPHRHLTPKLRQACPGDIPDRSQSTHKGQKRSGAHPLLPWECQTCSGTLFPSDNRPARCSLEEPGHLCRSDCWPQVYGYTHMQVCTHTGRHVHKCTCTQANPHTRISPVHALIHSHTCNINPHKHSKVHI